MSDSANLLRCWVEFDLTADAPEPAAPGTVSLDGGTFRYRILSGGIGVTGYDEADCLSLIEDLLDGQELPPIVRPERDVNVDALGIADRAGVPVWRGVWFPRFNLDPANRP